MTEGYLVGAFSLGQVVVTPNCLQVAEEEKIALIRLLARHAACDWGDLCKEDKQANDEAIGKTLRILSAYKVGNRKIWIITEADRSSTCIMLPEDY